MTPSHQAHESYGSPNGNLPNALALSVPPELVEAIAQRTAELVGSRSDSEPGYLDVSAAAAYLAAPKSRIYELVERERLVPYRDGRRLLFTRADLDAVLIRKATA